jgi:iron complex outermembrane receptor protein
MKTILVNLICVLLMCGNTMGQTNINTKVLDAYTKKPLAGANIVIGDKKTSTNNDGIFTYLCSSKETIKISYVGYETKIENNKNCNPGFIIYLTPLVLTLDEVEVSNSTNSNKTLLYQPASITNLNTTDIKRGTGLFFDDAIQTNVPGVQMARRSVGGGQQFNIRGYGNGVRGKNGASSNFDGQGSKVYLNGIPVTDAEGITTMDDIDFGSIASAEIVKGPAGSLYGLAIAGAINLKTVTPEKGKTSLGQEFISGNYGLRRNTTTFQTATNNSSLLINYGHQEVEGFTIHNASRKDYANVVNVYTPSDKQTVSSYFGYSNSYDQRAGELTIAQFENNDYSGNIDYIKRDGHSNVITFRAGINNSYKLNERLTSNTTVFGTSFTSNASSAAGWTEKATGNYGIRATIDAKFELSNQVKLSGITGIESQRQDAHVVGYNMKQNPFDTASLWKYEVNPYWVLNATTSDLNSTSTTSSLFSEWTLSLPKDLSITAGLGSSNMKITLNDRLNPALTTRPAKFEKEYAGMVSPHVAINKIINKHISLFASYSKGYKAPVSSYFYITTPAVTTPATPATGRVNETLNPEVGTQIEYGTKGQIFDNKLIYEFAYFHTVFENKMTAISVVSPANKSTTLYSYVVNGGQQRHFGVEGMVKYNLISSQNGFIKLISPFANFTKSDFTYANNFTIQKSVTSTENYTGKQVAGVPNWIVNAGIDMQFKGGFYANMTYNYKDKTPITGLNDYWTTSYNLLNGKIGFSTLIDKHFSVDAYIGATNITNTKYYLMVFANQLPDAYLPAPKNAMLFGGINVKYTF